MSLFFWGGDVYFQPVYNLARSPLKGDIPNKYPLYKVYMGLTIKGIPSKIEWDRIPTDP